MRYLILLLLLAGCSNTVIEYIVSKNPAEMQEFQRRCLQAKGDKSLTVRKYDQYQWMVICEYYPTQITGATNDGEN